MTIIKGLKLKGFKSFAKPIELEFGNDFNCIIGPNGSGKSNIGDSMCFVLGKLSAKSMRAEKSSNLIFNGGKKSNPLKEAEVSLIFSNENKEFPIDKAEIVISRIIRQNGTSIYKINDETKTRQEMLELLATAKIDPEGHNIVLQGDIIRFMEMKPEERRLILEEIAGISVYEDKKQKALLELEKVEKKVSESTIILNERETYLRELKKERDEALKYKDLEKNIKSNKATFLHIQIKEREEKREDVDTRINKHKEEINRINTKVDECKEFLETSKKTLQDINKEIEVKGEKESIDLQKELEKLKTELVKKNERSTNVKNEITKVEGRKKQLFLSLKDTEKSIIDLEQHRKELNEKIKDLAQKDKQLEEEIKKLRQKQGIFNIEDLDKVEKQLDARMLEQQQVQDEKQELLQKKFQIDAQILSLDEKIKAVEVLEKQANMKKIKADLEQYNKELSKLINEDTALASQSKKTEDELSKLKEEEFRLRIKESGMRESVTADKAIEKILSLKDAKVYGTVSQLGKVEPTYALALEVAAGPRMKSIVVENDKIAADCIQLLKREKVGTATFLPLNKIQAKPKVMMKGKGIIGNAIDLVSFDPQFKNIFSYTFGQTIVVEDIETARKVGIGKARMVTLEGDLAETSGAMIGGFRQKMRGLSFQEKGVSGSLSSLEKEIERLQKIKTSFESRRKDIQETLEEVRNKKALLEAEVIKREKTMDVNSDDLLTQKDKLTADKVFQQIGALDQKLEVLNKEIILLRETKDKHRDAMKTSKQSNTLEKVEARRQELRENVVQVTTELKNIDMQIKNIYIPEKTKTNQIISQHNKEIEDFKREYENLEEEVKQQTTFLKQEEEKELKFKKDYKNLFTKRNKLTEDIQKSEQDASREEEKIKEIQEKLNNISITRAKIIAELEGLQTEFEPFKGVEVRQNISQEKLKEEIKKFEQLLQNIGNVNLRALEVYEDIKKEYDNLLSKVEKLKVEREDVLQMMYEIESKKKDIFLKTYNIIRENFAKIFASLSTKGDALLELENPEDPLQAGVDIKVQITGNKQLDIRSLSGGEKTMAALAFIFAIQEYQPASFYLLDEIDAALDKRNSELLSRLIAKYSKTAQYILISHNDEIISEASHIYGVSMKESGMSKIVSLRV